MKFQNRLQNYTFLCIQPNKMHKISRNVHKSSKLCNYYLVNCTIYTIFELKLEARLHLENTK